MLMGRIFELFPIFSFLMWVQLCNDFLDLICQTEVFPCVDLVPVARAREDTEKFDRDVKQKAERLHHIATVCISRY